MNITVFGATGGTGQEVVKQALEAGLYVTAFARTPASVPMAHHANLTIVQGDALNPDDVADAISSETDAIITVLGHRRNSTQDHLLECSTQYIIQAMQAQSIKRIIALSGAGTWISDHDQPGIFEHFIRFLLKTFAGHVLEDSTKMTEVIRQTNLDWTIPRAPRIVDGDHKGDYRIGYVGVNGSPTISYADIADFIVKEVQANQYVHDAPVVSY